MTTTSNDADLIESVITDYARAFNARDIDAVMACYDAAAIAMLVPGQLLTTPAAIRAGVLDAFAIDIVVEYEGSVSLVTDGVALAVVQSSIRGTLPNGEPLERVHGRNLDVLRKQPDGRWLVAIDNGPGCELLDAGIRQG